MCLRPYLSTAKSFFLCAILSVSAVFSQSLSIGRKPDASVSLQAGPAAGESATLQVSENLRLWIDVTNDVPDQYTLPVDTSYGALRYYRLAPTPPEAPPVRIMTLGDSMVADCCGWGSRLEFFLKPNALLLNYAQAWTSTKVFLQSPEYDKMLLVKPNYVLMEFGYSDGAVDPSGDRGSTPEEFEQNLRTLVETIRGFNGVPILMTLHANRAWDSSGKLIPSDHGYNVITKRVAAELGAPLIDLYKITFDLFTQLGKDGCAFMYLDPANPADGMHVSPLGGIYLSQQIARFLPEAVGPYLTRVLDAPPKP
jgi:lysophospholipase L1-like esterase